MSRNVTQVLKEGVTLPKLPKWWRKELESYGCEVTIHRPKPKTITEWDAARTTEVKKVQEQEEIVTALLDGCILRIRFEQDYENKPGWQVMWDVEKLKDPQQKLDEEEEKRLYTWYQDDEENEDGSLNWRSGNECDSLVEVQRQINEWLWCVKEYNKVRTKLLKDMFLKEFQVTGCTMRVSPFPTEPHGSYRLADIHYGDVDISVSYDTGRHKWCFGGNVRKCSFKDPEGFIKSLHKRARRFLKGGY